MSDVTRILSALNHGDPEAAGQLLPLVYEELRRLAAGKLAHEKPGQTLQATALVHEAYLRLVGDQDPGWNGRAHFLAAAAEAMRRVLINRARDRGRLRRGGGRRREDLEDLCDPFQVPDEGSPVDLDEALERLAGLHPRPAELVKLRFFAGLSLVEVAAALEVSPRTANGPSHGPGCTTPRARRRRRSPGPKEKLVACSRIGRGT